MGWKYYGKSVLQAALTLFIVITISFVMYRLLPSNPVDAMKAQLMREAARAGETADPERINRLVRLYTGIQPNKPIYTAYFEYIRDIVLYQDFGRSVWRNDPVFDIILKAMPWSIFISIYGLVSGWIANLSLGALMAYKEGSRFDNSFTIVSILLSSTPYYVGAIVLLAVFAFQLGWFPTGGHYPDGVAPGFNIPFMIGIIYHAALPILSAFLIGFGGRALAMRGNAVRILGEDYVRVARLRGISSNRIAFRHVGQNAILPMYTSLMIGISAIFSSSIILEGLFTYPGVGWYTYGALRTRDYPLLMGIFIFYTTVTLIGILIADFTYSFIDPRVEAGDKEAF